MIEEGRSLENLSLEKKFNTYVRSLDPQVFETKRIDRVHISPLDGGHHNVTYLTKVNDKPFVMRFHPNQDHGDHTAEEYKKLQQAGGQHAPKALFLGKPDFIDSSVLIMEYVEGEHKDFSTLSSEEIKKLANAVADIHGITREGIFAKTPDIPEDVEGTYYDYLQSHIDNNILNRLRDADPVIYAKDKPVVQEAEKKLKIVDIPETFRFTFALRTVVKSAIAHVKQCDQTSAPVALHVSDRVNCALVRSLPLPERFVYFLLDQLNYSRRDAGLLVGLSDLQTEQLLSQARKRLDDARICEERRLAVNGVRVPLVAIY